MSFEVVNASGVRTSWFVTTTDPHDIAKQMVESLLEVEQLIADTMRTRSQQVAKTVYALGSREFYLSDGTTVEFRWEPYIFDWRCLDCKTDTDAIDEYYMVHDELWREAVADYAGHLCIGCLEARLGRGLTAADFTEANVNSSVTLARSPRLRDRLSRS